MQVGDRVRLNPNVTNFRYGRGSADYGDIGKLLEIRGDEVRIEFPRISYWRGLIGEIEKIEEVKTLENKEKCKDCGKDICEGVEIDGEFLCKECYEENYFFCRDCGKIERKENGYFVDNEYYVCEDCFNSGDYKTCEDCGDYVSRRNAIHINDGNGDYYWVCDSCGEHYMYCDDCGDRFHEDNLYERNGNWYCDECFGRHRLYGYHEFDDWEFFKGKDEEEPRYYIGSEIEVEPFGRSNESGVIDLLEENINAVGMYDGSLHSGGVEIVTHPESPQYKEENKENYKKFFEGLKKLNYGDNGGCGLHFHISRPSDEVVARIIVIVESFKNEIKKLSRRNSYRWCNFLTDSGDKTTKMKLQSYKYVKDTYCKKHFDHDERYHSINLTNDNTIEYRFFNGANNFEEYWGALQFIENVTDIALDTSRELTTINWQDLMIGEELREQAKKLGVLDIDKNVKDTTDIIEKYEKAFEDAKEEIKNTLKNLARYITKEISQLDISKFKNEKLEDISDKLDEFSRDFNYRKQYLGRVVTLYHYLQNDSDFKLDSVKDYWNNTKYSYPVNTKRYQRYDKLIQKAIKKCESEEI